MSTGRSSAGRLVDVSERWFRLLQWLYPPDFRDDMGQAVIETYRDRAREALIRGGVVAELAPDDLLVETLVNGNVRQSGRTSLMVFPPAFLVRWISCMMTLEPGDLIATGTPAGVGPLTAGDVVEVRIGGIGVLSNPVYPPLV